MYNQLVIFSNSFRVAHCYSWLSLEITTPVAINTVHWGVFFSPLNCTNASGESAGITCFLGQVIYILLIDGPFVRFVQDEIERRGGVFSFVSFRCYSIHYRCMFEKDWVKKKKKAHIAP